MLRSLGKLSAWVVSTAVIGLSLFIVFRQDQVIDWWLLRDYEPSAGIEQLADNTSMTELARRYFYVYDPQLLSRDTFRQRCTIAEESIVLGCYVSRAGIYIYDVEDEQLAGVRQVTAAHEMLHIAYERLTSSERERIDTLNRAVFNRLDNERVKETIEAYRQRDPTVVANELHSILATEVRQLTPELEEYYSQYFSDRLQVVALSEQYASVFEAARERVDQLDAQLKQQLANIESLQSDLEAQAARLEQQRDQLNKLLDQGDITAYNNGITSFNQGVVSYNQEVSRLGGLIDAYNELVSERNQAALAHESLIESIDSSPRRFDASEEF
jgi:uncharacterized phage infection (PIP) family protein YhgE